MIRLLAIIGILSTLCSRSSEADDSVESFYKGKTILLQIGDAAGDGYDSYGRLVARYIAKYIPAHPNVVVQDVPGGGSLLLANQFGHTTPEDGSVFGMFVSGMPTTPLLNPGAASFDPRKFGFIGSPNREVQVLVVSQSAAVKTVDDVFHKQLIVGASAPGAAPWDYPMMTNALLGTKFKIISGYSGPAETGLALERGEVEAQPAVNWTTAKNVYGQMIASGKLHVIAQYGFNKLPELPDVPLFPIGSDDKDRQIFRILYARQDYGRPMAFPPGVPAERVEAFRKAIAATVIDPEFLADAARSKLPINFVSGEELQRLTQQIYQTPPELVARMQSLLNTTTK
jgi:tripartite-type tricarboxylate transporter receptor subunit TctC